MIFFHCSVCCPLTRHRSYGNIYTIFDGIFLWQVGLSTFRGKYNRKTHFVELKIFLSFTNPKYMKHNIQLDERRKSFVDKR
jgi:hypothetical protein